MNIWRWMSTKLGRYERYQAIGPLLQEGYSYLKVEDYDKARLPFMRLLESRDDLKALSRKADLKDLDLLDYVLTSVDATWLMTERYDEAVTFFSKYINRYPGDAAAYCARAGNLWYLGQLEKAVEDYSRALELEPDDIVARSGRGQVLAEMGSVENALDDLDFALRSLRTRPASRWDEFYKHIEAFVHRGRGVALAGLGKSEPAMDEFNLSIKLSPENAWVYYSRAAAYLLLDSHKNASVDYELALLKKQPPLTPMQRERAKAQLRQLSTQL
jgi:tetratricopeptide (TPR) repeat protein